MAFTYPPARRSDVTDDYHGTEIADPYRWLEDPDSEETKAFVAAQNVVTLPYLAALPSRAALEARMTELWDTPRTEPPQLRNGVAVWAHNDGLRNQPVYLVRRPGDAQDTVLLDPNDLSDDGTVAVIVATLSPDGRLLAYTTSEAGSDRQRLRIRSVETGEDLVDELDHLRFTTVAWHGDGFFYTRWPETDPGSTAPVRDPSVHFHRIGDDQQADRLVFHNDDDPEPNYTPWVTHDDAYLVLTESVGTSRLTGILYADLGAGLDGPVWTRLTLYGEAMDLALVHHDGGLLVHTNGDAPNGAIVHIPFDRPAERRTVVAEGDTVIAAAAAVAGELVVLRLVDASHRLERYALDGTPLGVIELPGLGSVSGLTGRFEDPDVFVGFQSFVEPPSVLAWRAGVTSLFASARPIDPESILVERRRAVSSDGAEVGMFVIRRADAELPGPVELYGYGGFSIDMTPLYSPARLAFLDAGGIVVVTNLRGGTEQGEEWHRQGMLADKQQVFDDFIACGRALVDEGITTPGRLGIRGGSNGGLLTAAVMQQAPDLFGAVVSQVPVTDMLRYQHFTAGRFWTVEYGDAADPDAFEWLLAYSPLHNVEDPERYPPLLITTAESDDRVVPMHSHKLAATIQHAAGGRSDQPLLLRVETRAGHGLGKPTAKLIEEAADIYAFLLDHLS